jgi:hypothetical protein
MIRGAGPYSTLITPFSRVTLPRCFPILAMATKTKTSLDESGVPVQVAKLVAGAGSELCDIFNAQGLEPMTSAH